MGCRIGMATNVAARVSHLKAAGTVPQSATYRTLASDLTYSEANKKELELRKRCGPHCQGQAGGGTKSDRVWSCILLTGST